MEKKLTLFWFRRDLRIQDNPGLLASINNGTVLPIYIYSNNPNNKFATLGGASKWWLHNSLMQLDLSLKNKLNFYLGDPETIIIDLIKHYPITAVYWNKCYEPSMMQDDLKLQQKLNQLNIECKVFNGTLLWEPWEVLKSDGEPYKVYTHFYRNGCLKKQLPRDPLPKLKQLDLINSNMVTKVSVKRLDEFGLLPAIHWYKTMDQIWEPGEAGANKQLKKFLLHGLMGYKEKRNYPILPNVSRLSPYLHFGEISPHQLWYAVKNHMETNEDVDHFLSELGWREFSYYLLHHFPDLPVKNFQSKFDRFPWKKDHKLLKAWQEGKTGYPIVDAGMRELWQTGYIHNRVRMIVGSFLVKNLLIHWREGERWFWDCLVDADLANNSASWQWVAGSGADAAPYFRIFNPVTQGEKFDQTGLYTKHYLPELKQLPNQYLFKPWEAPKQILDQAGIVLGKTYPKPIVDLASSRAKALLAYKNLAN